MLQPWRATCWFSCWELWLLLHGDEEKRGLGWEEEKAPGTPMRKLRIQAHVQTQVQVLKCLLLQEQQRQDEDSGKVQRDRLAQLLTSKVYRVKSTDGWKTKLNMPSRPQYISFQILTSWTHQEKPGNPFKVTPESPKHQMPNHGSNGTNTRMNGRIQH